MARPLLRLMTLVAVLLMPFGMASAPAAAAAPAAPAAGMDGHCGDRQEPAGKETPKLHCAACAALPALDAPDRDIVPTPGPLPLSRAARVSGIEPDIATPPPKLG